MNMQTYSRIFLEPDKAGPDKFEVQCTKTNKPKSGYETRYSSTDEVKAVYHYRSLNIGNGYRKRLLKNGKTVRRATS